ncbi:hypothetical protein P4S73_06500 [Paraglaciecola sp. Hal342]
MYGVVAMLSYFPGGIIADKYPKSIDEFFSAGNGTRRVIFT